MRKMSGSRSEYKKNLAPIVIIFSVYDLFNRAALCKFLQFLLVLLPYYTMPPNGRKHKGKGSKVPAKKTRKQIPDPPSSSSDTEHVTESGVE